MFLLIVVRTLVEMSSLMAVLMVALLLHPLEGGDPLVTGWPFAPLCRACCQMLALVQIEAQRLVLPMERPLCQPAISIRRLRCD